MPPDLSLRQRMEKFGGAIGTAPCNPSMFSSHHYDHWLPAMMQARTVRLLTVARHVAYEPGPAACVVDDACSGCSAYFREAPADFTAAERDFVRELSPLLSRGFPAAGVRARCTGADRSHGLAWSCSTATGNVEAVTAAA